MRILVIGGSGFIGTVLVRRLHSAGHSVRIFDRQKSTAFPHLHMFGDVREQAAVVAASAGQDVIYNLAAEHRDDVRPRSLYMDVNVGGARNTVVAAEANAISRIVFTSSAAVYPLSEARADESVKPEPFNEYGRTKLLAEELFQDWQQSDPTRSLVVIRPTAVFGPGNRGNVYNLARQLMLGRFLMIGDGRNRKSLAYVDNVAEALVFVLGLDSGSHLFNYADHPDYDMMTLVADICDALHRPHRIRLRLPRFLGLMSGYLFDGLSHLSGRNFPVSSIRIRKFCANTQFASDRIRNLGLVPPVMLRNALKDTIRSEFVEPPPPLPNTLPLL